MRISDGSSDVCSSDLIPASASVAKMPAQIPQRKERTHATLPDRVPQPRIYRAWNVPQTGTDDATRLELIANILGGGNSSRLSRRLVHEDKLADSASAFAYIQEIDRKSTRLNSSH